MNPRGAFAPIPTPLDSRFELDPSALQAHLAWLASQQLDGVLVLGTNGEFPSLSMAERSRVAEVAAAAETGMQLMLGVGSCSLVEVLEMVSVAEANGYHSVLCPPPFYFRNAPLRGLADFFRAILDHAGIPVLLYHTPAVTGIPVSEALLDAIDGHTRLAGVKDSSGKPTELERLSRRFADRVYMVGSDHLVSACQSAGGRGSISAVASVAPVLVQRASQGGESQQMLDAVRTLLESYGLGPSVKAILRRAGLGPYTTRPPLIGLDAEREEELWREYCELVAPELRPKNV